MKITITEDSGDVWFIGKVVPAMDDEGTISHSGVFECGTLEELLGEVADEAKRLERRNCVKNCKAEGK